jgi:exodeoxyribonuclease-3
MKIMTANVNGIRSAASKGFLRWMLMQDADVVCLQETKAQIPLLSPELLSPAGYHGYFHDAVKCGYSGVALYSRREPDRVRSGLGWPDMDIEGRYLQADYGDLSIISLYVPSGSSGPERQEIKFGFLERFKEYLLDLRRDGREYILCGDWNIAHKNIDLKNWRGNRKNSGFLPEERAWMDWLFVDGGYVDVFRCLNQQEDQYTWWSNRGRAYEKNVGWRIDYHVATPGIATKARREWIYKDEKFSDHAPLIIEYDHELDATAEHAASLPPLRSNAR